MIHAYTLTFVLVSMLNGQQVRVPQTWEDLASPEHCLRVVREVQRDLPRGVMLRDAICSRTQRWRA